MEPILSVARRSATNGKGHIQLRDQLLPRVSAPGTGAVRRCGNFENASFCEVRQTACRRGFHSRYHHAQDPSAYSSQTRSFDFALTSGLEITGPANPSCCSQGPASRRLQFSTSSCRPSDYRGRNIRRPTSALRRLFSRCGNLRAACSGRAPSRGHAWLRRRNMLRCS